MNADAKSVQDILYSPHQFLVPFFQRHYSWKVVHWQRLWDDLRVLANGTKKGKHFLGPLVCTPASQMPGDMPTYLLIDGQQRLTTLTVLLATLRDLAREHQLPELAQQIDEGYLTHKWQKELKRYKVVPRAGDREVLFAVIDGQHAEFSRRDGIVLASRFFKAAAAEFIESNPEPRLRGLLGAATSQMSLVVVNIDGENPYEIFESLNSTGLPLEEADLIRNYIFMQVPLGEQTTFNDLHWQPFESLFEETDEYDAVPPTLFYRDYLMRNGEYNRKGETFHKFRETLHGRSWNPVELVQELRRYATIELMLRRPRTVADQPLQKMLLRIEQLKITTAFPLILHLISLKEKEALSHEDLLGCLHDLESFVIRRSVCGESSRGYGEDFAAAIKSIKQSPRQDLRSYWVSRGWPDDETFISRLPDFEFYRREPLKCRVMLEALEESFGHKERSDMSKLSIEHVAPQSIEDTKNGKAWQEMLGSDWKVVHGKWLDTLGNLTLTGYNPKLSNRAFSTKQELFAKSKIDLNGYFAGMKTWNADAIKRRGAALAKSVAKLWDRPAGVAYLRDVTSSNDSFTAADPNTGEYTSYRDYWEAFLTTLAKEDPTIQPKSPSDRAYLTFPTDYWASRFATLIDDENGAIAVELCLTGKHRASALDLLAQDREGIDAALKFQTDWEHDGNPSKVVAYLDAASSSDRQDWPRQHAWLASMLKRFYLVFKPRLFTPMDAVDRKKLIFEFWSRFNERFEENGGKLQLPAPKPSGWRTADLGAGVALWMNFVPEENWLGAGLEFGGRKGLLLSETARALIEELAKALKSRVYFEQESSNAYLSAYLNGYFTDRNIWEAAQNWLENVLETSEGFVIKHLRDGKTGKSLPPIALQ